MAARTQLTDGHDLADQVFSESSTGACPETTIKLCAWCRRLMSDLPALVIGTPVFVSHSICGNCRAQFV